MFNTLPPELKNARLKARIRSKQNNDVRYIIENPDQEINPQKYLVINNEDLQTWYAGLNVEIEYVYQNGHEV